MANVQSLFKKTVEAKANDGGVYFEPGQYLINVDALKMIVTQVKGVDAFILESTILKSDCKERPAGSSCSWYAGYDKPSTPGNVKGLFEAMFPGEPIDVAGMEAAVSDGNPCKGMVLHIEAVKVKTRTGGDYTKCKFRLATDEEKASLSP